MSTPLLPRGPYVLAGWWRRALAMVVDAFVIVGAGLLLLAGAGAVFSVGFFASVEAGTVSLIVGLVIGALAFVAVAFVYAPVLMALTDGQTLGKMATGIRVIRTNGQPMDFWWAALREVAVKGIATMAANSVTFGLAQLVDCLWPLWDDENRALHDFACATRVVRA